MLNKILLPVLLPILFLGVFTSVRAQMEDGVVREALRSFDAQIKVNTDNSVTVTEKVVYDTGNIERHGLLRDIYIYSSQNRKMKIDVLSVTDDSGNPYLYTTSGQGDYFRVKIGDADKTFAGQRSYVIKYRASNAAAQFKDFDEIYWNVTGNEWNIPIYSARASVVLPEGVNSIQSACYYGPKGSKTQCSGFTAPGVLNAGEGLTVAVGFPKGVVAPYTSADNAQNFFQKYGLWIIAGLLPVLTLIFSLRYWYKNGRDPKGTGVIVAQYEVPDNLTPMEVAGIVKERVDSTQISAEIIYLATLGYLKINQIEKKHLGFIKTTDYELIKLKDFSGLSNEGDRKLMEALFKGNDKVAFSELKNKFYKDVPAIKTSVLDSLLNKNYYKNLGRLKTSGARWALVAFFAVFIAVFFGGIGGGILVGNPLPLILGVFASVIIYGIVSYFYPAKTEKGVATKEYLLGLKDYLQIAEKDRLIFHNAPEKKPEVFQKLLPFAMVLGVAKIWAKEFEDIYITPPSWYSGPAGTHFNSIVFYDSLSHFNSAAMSSFSSPGGSGSGGGGSSGGGGGGGGGGGW